MAVGGDVVGAIVTEGLEVRVAVGDNLGVAALVDEWLGVVTIVVDGLVLIILEVVRLDSSAVVVVKDDIVGTVEDILVTDSV